MAGCDKRNRPKDISRRRLPRANTPIPLEIFEGALEISSETCDEGLAVLYGLGLLRESEALPAIHPLLAEYARTLAKANGKILEALVDTLARLSNDANNTGIPADFNFIKPHIQVLVAFAEDTKLEKAANLWNSYGYHLKMIADYAGARAAFERALKIDEANFAVPTIPTSPQTSTIWDW